MKIIREGKEIELTSEELFSAYKKQQHMFDVANIEDNMELYLNGSEYKLLKFNRNFIEKAAFELRNNQDKYDMDFENAIKDAFDETKLDYLYE